MQISRKLGEGRCFYHCMSRVIDQQPIFREAEKDFFHGVMRRLEMFLEVRLVTYCLMPSQFHLLLEVPDPDSVIVLDKKNLVRRLSLLYSKSEIINITEELREVEHDKAQTQKILDRYQRRIGKLDRFMKELKQRFSIWYNRKNERHGTLWEQRFKSTLLQDQEKALLTIAAFIDLNPALAGLVDDPKDYRWCGYGEAVKGDAKARQGLGAILEEALQGEQLHPNWNRTHSRYRKMLYDEGS